MQISYVNVFVADLEKATEFYRDKLGLHLQFSSPEHGYASFAAGSVRLGVALPGTDHAELVGRHTGVGFEVADLEAEHRRLSGLGVRFTMPPTRQPWGGFMAMIADAVETSSTWIRCPRHMANESSRRTTPQAPDDWECVSAKQGRPTSR
jgi:catechol 2,3-dioxygenase-like lactoylglutathione lyase family enzyme